MCIYIFHFFTYLHYQKNIEEPLSHQIKYSAFYGIVTNEYMSALRTGGSFSLQ